MTKSEVKYCLELARKKKLQSVRDFDETKMFDLRKKEVYHTTSDKVVNLIRTRCMNLHGRINAKEFNKIVPFLLDRVTVYDI